MMPAGTPVVEPRRRSRRRLGAFVAAALLLAAATPAAAQPDIASGGYWRDAEGSGHYRASVLGHEDGSRVRIEWISTGERGVVTSVTTADLGDGGPWQVSNAEFRPEGDATLLMLSAYAPWSGERRTVTLELGAPGVAGPRNGP